MQKKVIDILVEFTEVPAESITLQSGLAADLNLSSLDVINLVVAFEDAFGVEVPDEDIKGMATVGDIVEYLEKHLK